MARSRTLPVDLTPLITVSAMTGMLIVFLLCLFPFEAFAQATDFRAAAKSIGRGAGSIPKFVAMIAYVCGAFFAASGLLKLKDWINEGDKSPLQQALMRLVVATLLIWMPHVFIVTNGSFFLRADGNQNANTRVPMAHMSVFKRANP